MLVEGPSNAGFRPWVRFSPVSLVAGRPFIFSKEHTVKGASVTTVDCVHQSAKHVGWLASTPMPTHSHAAGACLTALAEPDLHSQRKYQGLLQMAAAGAAGQRQRLFPAH